MDFFINLVGLFPLVINKNGQSVAYITVEDCFEDRCTFCNIHHILELISFLLHPGRCGLLTLLKFMTFVIYRGIARGVFRGSLFDLVQ